MSKWLAKIALWSLVGFSIYVFTSLTSPLLAVGLGGYLAADGINRLRCFFQGKTHISASRKIMEFLGKKLVPRVGREFTETRATTTRYVVRASSFDEAKELFEKDPSIGRFVGQQTIVTDSIGDQSKSEVLGEFPSDLELEPCDYVIDVMERKVLAGSVSVPRYMSAEETLPYVREEVEQKPKRLREIEDVTDYVKSPANADGRYFEHEGKRRIYTQEEMQEMSKGAHLVMVFSSALEVYDFLSNGTLEGARMFLDSHLPEVQKGQYVLSLPLDPEMLPFVTYPDRELTRTTAEKYGVSDSRIDDSLLFDALKKYGQTPVEIDGHLDMSGVKINGVDVSDFRQAMAGVGLREDAPDMQEWLKDAEKIQSVNIDVDEKNREVRMVTNIKKGNGTEQRIMTKVLEEQDFNLFKLRYQHGIITSTEMRDLVMMCYPDKFSTYADEYGRPKYKDCFGAFLRSEVPQKNDLSANPEYHHNNRYNYARNNGIENSNKDAVQKRQESRMGMKLS